MNGMVLIVDDEADTRHLLTQILGEDYVVAEADDGMALKKAFNQTQPDVIVLDVILGSGPDNNGLELLPQIKKRWPETEVIMLTGKGTMEMAAEAGKRGAYNFLSKPFENEKLLADVKCAIERKQQNEENSSLRRALETMSGAASPVFRSAAMQEVVRTVERLAPSDVTVLITGESGTGKEVIADLIHAISPRSKNKIIKINCAALPRELIESELFGSVKGAFTGANVDREGLFRQAEGGTLLLDEISEMPIDTQAKLLRILEDSKVRRLGAKTEFEADVRLLASTNKAPEEAVRGGHLREDLYYRLNVFHVHLPPLRDRKEDIPPMAEALLGDLNRKHECRVAGVSPAVAPLRMERPILRASESTRRIVTCTSWPTVTASSGFSIFLSDISEMWSRPSRFGSSSTNAPNEVSFVIFP